MIRQLKNKSLYTPIYKKNSIVYVVSWEYEDVYDDVFEEGVDEQGNPTLVPTGEKTPTDYACWTEEYFTHKPSIDEIQRVILGWYDKQTDYKILNGYQWTVLHGADAGKVANVWLTMENQQNYKAYHDTAKDYPQLTTYPVKYKVGENPDKTAIYEEFANFEELAQFYLGGVNFIKQTVEEGWAKKDSIDWSVYVLEEPEQESEIVD